ncbi:MAG: response regulator [Anaerolineae bacterium]|nr:response regulator [Anaerolineae bacterium]
MVRHQRDATEWPYQKESLALRVNALHRLIIVGISIGILWYAYTGIVLENSAPRMWGGAAILVLASIITYKLSRRWGFTCGAYAYIAGVTATVLFASWSYTDPSLLLLIALSVSLFGLLIGPRAGFLAAALASVCIIAGSLWYAPQAIPRAIAWKASLFSSLMALLLWVATYPLRMTLHWSWMSYEQARRQREELRRQRGQLSRTIKDLDLAYHRLEAMTIELERARRAADEARRLKAEFAANISHELRTPLNLIIGFSEMMVLAQHIYGEPLPPAYHSDVQAIYRNAKHLSNLIDDVLDLSQIEAGRMGLVKEPTKLADVAAEAIGAIAHMFQSKGLYLITNIPDDLPLVPADRTRVRQVLINLLNNAARFTDRGGVTVTAAADDRELTIAVADTGIGISEEDIPKVFEEFRQLDGSIRRRAGGSGLGLAISKRFIEMHGGRMWVESKVGQGTTFYFTLPLEEPTKVSQLPPAWETWALLPPGKAKQRTVIVIDPEPATARLFERYLDDYQVIHAPDENAARRIAAQTPTHALVIVAPSGEAGWVQLRRAREGLPAIPVAVCTLHGGPMRARPAGVATYLVKPVSHEQFLKALEGLGPDVHDLLIVDDAPEVVQLLSRMVQTAPQAYHVWRAYGGAQALETMRRHRPDAVVLDLLMPEVDGYTVLEHMRSDPQLMKVPVIVVTAKGQEEEVITAGLVGITRREGFSVGELMRCLKANLDALRPPTTPHIALAPTATSAE